jgi:hypothetical protein
MNERIRELAKQYLLHDRYSPNHGYIEGDYYEFEPEELAEFVQSIVQECINNLDWHGHDDAVSQLNWFLHNKIRS